jgi:hypothetical protein
MTPEGDDAPEPEMLHLVIRYITRQAGTDLDVDHIS